MRPSRSAGACLFATTLAGMRGAEIAACGAVRFGTVCPAEGRLPPLDCAEPVSAMFLGVVG